ncbi:copper homeostasis protein CutC [Nocardia sp. NPDC006044]|uniref:copper homeostasis protein CutC n=1 Tax=Nocardia sp. NPDC006044 TaxID=3364306 RepID=UPI0036AACF34
MRVEICVESVGGVRVAEEAGADRIELCGGLSDGGLTPSVALIERAVALTAKTQVHVLIRPRAGDFRYSADEVSVMVRDIEAARAAGADGVVVGALDAAGALDPVNAAFLEAAQGLAVTLHRAIDVSASAQRTLDRAIAFGFARVLTSGRQRSALEGATVIRDLVRQAAGSIEVMAGGGIWPSNVGEVIDATGVSAVHAAVRTPVSGAADLFAGIGVPQGFDRFDTDPEAAVALCELVRGRS